MNFWGIHECDELCVVKYYGVGRPPTPWCKRFASHILYIDECWIWENVVDKRDCERNRLNFSLRCGDLADRVGNYQIDACRWIYERVVGPIPDGLQLDHFFCNNWRCVHPYHTEPVTNLENNSRYASTRATWTQRDSLGRFNGRLEVV